MNLIQINSMLLTFYFIFSQTLFVVHLFRLLKTLRNNVKWYMQAQANLLVNNFVHSFIDMMIQNEFFVDAIWIIFFRWFSVYFYRVNDIFNPSFSSLFCTFIYRLSYWCYFTNNHYQHEPHSTYSLIGFSFLLFRILSQNFEKKSTTSSCYFHLKFFFPLIDDDFQ